MLTEKVDTGALHDKWNESLDLDSSHFKIHCKEKKNRFSEMN